MKAPAHGDSEAAPTSFPSNIPAAIQDWLVAQFCGVAMTKEIPAEFLRRLIAMGESQDFSGMASLFRDFPLDEVGHFMRQTSEFWFFIADSLSDRELEALIRALTVAEREVTGFSGGSVSGVIWTFRRLEERSGARRDLAEWILANTTNYWAPYGRANGGARSLAQLSDQDRRHEASRTDARRLNENQRVAAAHRRADKATRDLPNAVRRQDIKAIQALLLRGARVDVPDETGITALSHAQASGHTKIVALLLEQLASAPPPTRGEEHREE